MIHKERLAAHIEGDFVVFLIGVRVNQPWKIHKWLPVFGAMPRMLRELYANPALGLIHHETWFSRSTIMVQYWRSLEQLMDYAKARNAEHLPAWRAFNQSVGTDGSVGIWHETYAVAPGCHEGIYVNMPTFGLGKAGAVVQATGVQASALGRMGRARD